MKLSTEAQAWLTATVQRVIARHHLPEPERAGVHYELMSHLHAAGEGKAREAGRDEVTVGDLHAALLDMGGEEALSQAFVAPRARPVPRAGVVKRTAAYVVDVVIILVAWWVIGGIFLGFVALILWPFGLAVGDPNPFDALEALFPPFGRFPARFNIFGFGIFGLGVLIVLGYFTYFEGTRGRSFGKQVFDLRVQRLDGSPPTFREALIRNLVKVFPPLLLLDALFMLVFFNEEKQRVSDRLAETIVVEAR